MFLSRTEVAARIGVQPGALSRYKLPEPDAFLRHLVAKAGLPPDFWDADVRLERYTVDKWREGEAAHPERETNP